VVGLELPMPPEPAGLRIGMRRLPLETPTLPPAGVVAPGRYVVVGVRSPSECVFDLRHAFIGGDLWLAAGTGRSTCGWIRMEGGTAAITFLLRYPDAALLAFSVVIPPLILVSLSIVFGPLFAGIWIALRWVFFSRGLGIVARDAVWALGLAARGESPWRSYE
jgi:hypothetical protein